MVEVPQILGARLFTKMQKE